jgi:hypothetical protein
MKHELYRIIKLTALTFSVYLNGLLSFPRNEKLWNSCTYTYVAFIMMFTKWHSWLWSAVMDILACHVHCSPVRRRSSPWGQNTAVQEAAGRQLVYCELSSWPGGSVVMLPPCCHTATCSGLFDGTEFWYHVFKTSGEIWKYICVVLHEELSWNWHFWKYVCDIWYFGCWE